MQAPLERDEGAAEPVIGPHQPGLDAEPAAERERPGLLREEGIGPALDEEAVAPLGLDGAAQPIGGLEEREVHGAAPLSRPLDHAMGGGQSRDPAAYDDHPRGQALTS